MAHQDDVGVAEQLYPCATPGCVNKRTAAQGGTTFTVCDTCWEDSTDRNTHVDTCVQRLRFSCVACGKDCCEKHGIPLAEDQQGKREAVLDGRRCTFCADAGR